VELRPTPDALRERAFAILGDRVAGERFLDLYAGTGAVGLEALSRGAREVVFVERHRPACRLIEANCTTLGVTADRARVLARPALATIPQLSRRGEVFGAAWVDPPFELWREGLDVLIAAFEAGVLKRQGIACLECPEQADLGGDLPHSLIVERDLKGGASRVVMVVRK
jgi:16S rRNA (guanine(966)-N(2))-methyltransferase RsmD